MTSKTSTIPNKEKVKKLTKKRKIKATTNYDSDSDTQISQAEADNDTARLSDDEDFPISDDEGGADTVPSDTMSGWATAMSKVLKTKGSLSDNRSLILSKAAKVEQIEKKKVEAKKAYSFEVAAGVAAKVEATPDETKPGEQDLKTEAKRLLLAEKAKQRDYFKSLRMKPSIVDLDRERTLKKIATKGCVQLFNAVRSQQKDLNQQLESTKLEYKKDDIIKGLDKKRFLGTLMGGQRSKSELVDNPVKDEDDIKSEASDDDEDAEKKKGWGALRADFMTGKKGQGWDQKSDDSDQDPGSDDDDDESD